MRGIATLMLVAGSLIMACGPSSNPSDPCAPQVFTCAAPPAPRCDGNTLVTSQDGVCSADTGQAVCTYPEQQTDCTATDQVCMNGACRAPDAPCAMTTCDTPPAAACNGDTAVTYDAAGTCDSSSGSPTCSYAEHDTDCTATQQVCQGGACVDPCTGVTCDMPPADSCTGAVVTQFPATGTCDGSSGTAMCTYTPTTTDCAAMNLACDVAQGGCYDACTGVTCDAPPAASCAGGVYTTYPAAGTCDSTNGQCSYAPMMDDCAMNGQACDPAQGCTAACSGTCDAPPAATCDAGVYTTYAAVGTCDTTSGVCAYAPTTTDCAAMNEACDPTAGCVDPCVGVTCDTPPAASCSGDTLTTYAPTGTCASPGGVAECDYAPTPTDCTMTAGDECIAGACQAPLTIGFCRLQFPTTISDVASSTQTIYGRVYVAGVTDATGVDDPDPRLVGGVGFGATGTDPSTWTTWTAAAPNASYGPGSAGYEMNNDEYRADAQLPATPGQMQDYGYRFSGDGGRTWTYCDAGDTGSSDGFSQPGVATIVGPFFSEYVEGSSNNKAVEIYNPGPGAFPLAGCTVATYSNGSATVTSQIALDGTAVTAIAAGDVFVACNSSYALGDAAQCDVTSGNAKWNGNDAVQLSCNGVSYDVIGQIGVDPGTEWGTGNTSTADNTLLRVCTQTTGDPDGSDAFDPSVQWAGYATDTSFLGDRSCPLPTVP